MARCCAAQGIPAAVARSLTDEHTRGHLALAESRLPVHVARALDAALRGVTPGESRQAPSEPEAVVEGDSDAIGGRVSGVTGEQAQPP